MIFKVFEVFRVEVCFWVLGLNAVRVYGGFEVSRVLVPTVGFSIFLGLGSLGFKC